MVGLTDSSYMTIAFTMDAKQQLFREENRKSLKKVAFLVKQREKKGVPITVIATA